MTVIVNIIRQISIFGRQLVLHDCNKATKLRLWERDDVIYRILPNNGADIQLQLTSDISTHRHLELLFINFP